MDTMAVAALSMAMSMSQVQQSASVSILDKAMDAGASGVLELLDEMPAPVVQHSFGHVLDTYV